MNILIHRGNIHDSEAFIRLLHDVKNAMPRPEFLFLDPDEDIREMMGSGNMHLWVAMDGERIAGAFDILIPGLNEYNYGYDLGFDRDQLLRVINMDTAVVHPVYRGLGLQKRLMAEAEKEIHRQKGRILLCTVHPENEFSLRNVLDQGYRIMKKCEKYGSVRYILRKDLT